LYPGIIDDPGGQYMTSLWQDASVLEIPKLSHFCACSDRPKYAEFRVCRIYVNAGADDFPALTSAA